ncbi:MAG: EMC3/TMCO1 family protein [Candidatus Thorarchaeota archaeon]
MDFWTDLIQYLASLLDPVSSMPISTVFIPLVSMALALISIAATRQFADVEQMQKDMDEVKEWREKLNKARETQDERLLQEVQEEQSRIMRLQSNMMSSRCKPTCITWVPFIFVFIVLRAVYSGGAVAILPFNVHEVIPFLDGWLGVNVEGSGFGLYFYVWYVISSFSINNLLQKVFGVAPPRP